MASCKHGVACTGKCEHAVSRNPLLARVRDKVVRLKHQNVQLEEEIHAQKELNSQAEYGRPRRQRAKLLGMILNARFQDKQVRLRVRECRDIGSGAEGQVVAAVVEDTSGETGPLSVAIKVVYIDTPAQREGIERQITLWKNIDNPHVLPLLGAANLRADGTLVGLITPLLAGGTLDSLPAVPNQQPLEIRKRLLAIRQVALGIEYMHSESRIVHGDIKGGNVLLSEQGDAVIADFGLSTSIAKQDNPTLTDVRGAHTLRFAAPELLEDAAYDDASPAPPRSKTTYSDIYAFGSLVYETWTGSAPWADMDDRDVIITINSGCIPPRQRPGVNHAPFSDELWDLCLRCWNRDVRRRPTAGEIVRTLNDIIVPL